MASVCKNCRNEIPSCFTRRYRVGDDYPDPCPICGQTGTIKIGRVFCLNCDTPMDPEKIEGVWKYKCPNSACPMSATSKVPWVRWKVLYHLLSAGTGSSPSGAGAPAPPAPPPTPTPPAPTGPQTGTLVVKVKDEKGRDMSRATVSILGFTTLTLTGSDYTFNDVPVGRHIVTCSLAGYETAEQSVNVRKGAVSTVVFRLKVEKVPVPGRGVAIIYGKVTDAEAKGGIENASVSGLGLSSTTGPDGGYRFDNVPPGKHRLTADKAGYIEQRRTVEVGADEAKEVNFELKKEKAGGASVFAPITRHLGKPVGFFAMLAIGLIAIVLTSNVLFFTAFLCWAVYSMVPSPHTMGSIREKVEEIEKEIEKETDPEEIKKIEAKISALRGEVDIMKAFREYADVRGEFWGGIVVLSIRELLKIVGILFFGLGLLYMPLPFASLIGIVALLAGYFMIGGTKETKKEEK